MELPTTNDFPNTGPAAVEHDPTAGDSGGPAPTRSRSRRAAQTPRQEQNMTTIAWTRMPGTRRPRVFTHRVGNRIVWGWRCDEHEREIGGYHTLAAAHEAATHHAARRH